MYLPILTNHDKTRPVLGFAAVEGGDLMMTFKDPLPRDVIARMLGDAGWQLLEIQDNKVKKLKLLEWSVVP